MSKAPGATGHPRRRGAERAAGDRRITLQEIAQRAGGVHPSTVSLALRNAPSISLPLRRRLQALAARMGYRRDPWLDAFNARRLDRRPHSLHPTIAFIVDLAAGGPIEATPGLGDAWRGAVAAAELLHHRVEVFSVGPVGLSPARLEGVLQARGIDAVIWAGLRAGAPEPEWNWDAVTAVKIDCFDWTTPGFTAAADLRQGARLAVNRMQARGCRRIGLALDAGRGSARNDLLIAGYLVEMAAGGGGPGLPPLTVDRRVSARLVLRWMEQQRLDAVLGDWSLLAAESGAARDSTVGRAAVDVTDAPIDTAGIVMPHERVGAIAVEQVVSLSRANQRGLAESAAATLVPPTWREGRTLPRLCGA